MIYKEVDHAGRAGSNWLSVDMPALPGILGLEIVRHYNSASGRLADAPSMMGQGWRLSYDWALRFHHARHNEQIVLVQGDGTQHYLVKDRQNANWAGGWRAWWNNGPLKPAT